MLLAWFQEWIVIGMVAGFVGYFAFTNRTRNPENLAQDRIFNRSASSPMTSPCSYLTRGGLSKGCNWPLGDNCFLPYLFSQSYMAFYLGLVLVA
jgi:hypothetical protein